MQEYEIIRRIKHFNQLITPTYQNNNEVGVEKYCTLYINIHTPIDGYDSPPFIKIGITSRPINTRYSNKEYKNYPYKCTHLYIFKSRKEARDVENMLLSLTKGYQYNPPSNFSGRTECRDMSIGKILFNYLPSTTSETFSTPRMFTQIFNILKTDFPNGNIR